MFRFIAPVESNVNYFTEYTFLGAHSSATLHHVDHDFLVDAEVQDAMTDEGLRLAS